jgi:adenylate cyclase
MEKASAEKLVKKGSAGSAGKMRVETGLQWRQVTVLVANLVGVNAMAERDGPEVESALGNATEIILSVIKAHRGSVVNFAGGIVFAAFNAVSNNSSHGIYACQSALGILERLKKQSSVLRVRIGLHTCQVLAGNIRTGNAATFNILGSGVRMCFIMARLNAQLKTSVLLSSTTYDKARDHFVTRGVDVVKVAETGTNAVLYELISEMEVNDEWMYVLQERANNVSEYDKGWSLFMKGDHANAAAIFKRHLADNPGDAAAQRLLGLAIKLMAKPDGPACYRSIGVPWDRLEDQ